MVLWEDSDSRLFRPVATDPPQEYAFLSEQAKGRPPIQRRSAVLHTGVEMYATPENAVSRAVRGAYLCEIAPRPGHGVAVARVGAEGLFVVWGAPEVLLSWSRVLGGAIP